MNNKIPMSTVAGLATARGFAVGPVFVYRSDGDIPVPEFKIEPGQTAGELARFKRAVEQTVRDLEGLIAVLRERTGRADVRVFECHLMIIEDAVLIGDVERAISGDLINAEAAVRRVIGKARVQFERMNDPYFRERVRDIDDVERRLQTALTGYDRRPHLELKSPAIVVADDLTPSEAVQLPREFVLGFAMNGGSSTSHAALLARALAIPAVTGLGDITARVKPGEIVLLDGTNGAVTLNPDDETRRSFEALVRRQREAFEEMAGAEPGRLKDGGSVRLCANIQPGVPVANVRAHGARGVGLYRSEYLWLSRELEPTENEQFEAYRTAAAFTAALGEKAFVTIRLLDIGGDKIVRGISSKEANPFLGNRSIRYLLSHRDVLRTQVRAILRASAFGRVKILCPMISCVEEMREVEREIAGVKRALEAEGLAFDGAIPVGAMIEVPSAALNADALARHADFFSIGTNDLVQYTMAADRGNEAVANLYQPMNPAVVRLVRMTLDAARARGIDVCVCGESASDPVVGLYWAALGVGELSMSAPYIPVISKCLSCLSRADLDAYAAIPETLPRDASADEIYAACRAWLVSKIGDAGGEWL
jgi:phosphotransferase system enzyme I (PtsI)